jgi:hypothetical protein
MKDYDITDQRYGRRWTEHAKIETSQRTWNQGTLEGWTIGLVLGECPNTELGLERQ